MRRSLGAPIVAVAIAVLILVPTTFAVGEPGSTLHAQLRFNRFPGGFAAVESQLHFLTDGSARIDVRIVGGAGRRFAIRVYADGTCVRPGRWVINRAPPNQANAFIEVMGNSSVQIPVQPLDLARLFDELAGNPNEQFALAVAVLNPFTNLNYRTCTNFVGTPFTPITTSTTTSTTSRSSASTSSSRTTTSRTSTATSTGTRTSTLTSFLTTTELSTGTTSSIVTAPVTTIVTARTTTIQSAITVSDVVTLTVGNETVTFSSATTVSSPVTTRVTTFTTPVTRTTGTTVITTTTTFTTTTTLTL